MTPLEPQVDDGLYYQYAFTQKPYGGEQKEPFRLLLS